jgi:phage tail P2-like protein
MTTETPSLLPPNASPLERSLEAVTVRAAEIDVELASLWDPAELDLALLPWLAWSLAVEGWDAGWSEEMKRQAVAQSIELHRQKGTRASVRTVLDRFDHLLELVEWHQAQPRRDPHTFEVRLQILANAPTISGGPRNSARFAEAIVREISRVKPLREHFQLVQEVALTGGIGLQAVGRAFGMARTDLVLAEDTTQPWADLLTDENGEPLQDASGAFLDTAL